MSIFVGYRRSDTQGHAGRVADDLAERYGEGRVFRDIEIVPGTDFATLLRRQVSTSSLLLLVIGPDWLDMRDADGARRLDNEDDWVRLEVETAMEHGVPIIPLLVGAATMPAPDELPESLRPICAVQAHIMADRSWDHDLDQLCAAIERRVPWLRPSGAPEAAQAARPRRRSLTPTLLGLGRHTLRLAKKLLVMGLFVALGYFVLENYASAESRQFVYGFFAFLRDTVVGIFTSSPS